MYLFGGSGGMCENTDLYALDLDKYTWSIVNAKAKDGDASNLPVTRDEHSCVIHDGAMVIFGGFKYGERTNDIFKYHFEQNVWEEIKV
jgi:hypothetical protein